MRATRTRRAPPAAPTRRRCSARIRRPTGRSRRSRQERKRRLAPENCPDNLRSTTPAAVSLAGPRPPGGHGPWTSRATSAPPSAGPSSPAPFWILSAVVRRPRLDQPTLDALDRPLLRPAGGLRAGRRTTSWPAWAGGSRRPRGVERTAGRPWAGCCRSRPAGAPSGQRLTRSPACSWPRSAWASPGRGARSGPRRPARTRRGSRWPPRAWSTDAVSGRAAAEAVVSPTVAEQPRGQPPSVAARRDAPPSVARFVNASPASRARSPARQPLIIRSWFQPAAAGHGYDVRRSSRPVTRTSCSESSRVPDGWSVSRQRTTPSRSPATGSSRAGAAPALGVQQQVDGVGQLDRHSTRASSSVILATARICGHQSRVVLEVAAAPAARGRPAPARSSCARNGVRRGSRQWSSHRGRGARHALERPRRLPAYVASWSSCSRSRTASTCSVSPATASVRSAWPRTRGSSWVDSAAAPSPAPADLVPGRDLEAHLGRPPVLVGQARDAPPVARRRPTRRAARARPRCAASSRPHRRGRAGGSPASRGRSRRPARRGGPRASAPPSSSTQSSTTPRLSQVVGQLRHQVAHVRLESRGGGRSRGAARAMMPGPTWTRDGDSTPTCRGGHRSTVRPLR